MLNFKYQALDKNKQLLKGKVSAKSERAAIRQLEQKDLQVVNLETDVTKLDENALRKPLKQQDLILSFYELATMVNSGVPISEAVLAQQESILQPRLKVVYESISSKLRSGETFSVALTNSSLDLPDYIMPMLEAGEMTGELGKTLTDIVEQMEYDQKVANELRNALIYPAILVFTGFMSVMLMFTVVVPNFANVLEQGKDLHWLASTVLTVGMWTNDNLWLLLSILAGGSYGVYYLMQKESFRAKLLSSLLQVPMLKEWLIEAEIARWSKLLGTLLKNKVVLIKALQLSLTGVKSDIQKIRLNQVTNRVKAGQTLSNALEDNQALNPTGYNMIRIGEKAGALPAMLLSLAKLYENTGRERMKSFLIMVEPIAIIIIGALIGVIIAGIVLAITSANDLVI
mgnify:CR=1 FL=1